MADSAGTTDPDGDAAVAAGMPICVTTSAKVPAREEEMTAAVAPPADVVGEEEGGTIGRSTVRSSSSRMEDTTKVRRVR